MEKKHKLPGNDPYAKKIKVKNEQGVSDSRDAKKGNKREIKKKNMEEVTESDDKMEMWHLSSNLEGYFGSKCMTNKDNVDSNKERKTKSNVGSKASRHDEGNPSDHPTSFKRDSTEDKMDM